jgi:hypothetical protein
VISARRYRLVSRPFRLRALTTLHATFTRRARSVRLEVRYPSAVPERDFTARPPLTGRAVFRVGGRRVTVPIRDGVGTVRGARVRLLVARDGFGNRTR